jgi:hypothetical protein
VWLRVAHRDWTDPLSADYADEYGGRWNAPGDGPTLYLNADEDTARAQIRRLLEGTPVDYEDLADDAPFVLVSAALPKRQRVADAGTDLGLVSLGLPTTYPRRPRGGEVSWAACRRAAHVVRTASLRGVLARSAALPFAVPAAPAGTEARGTELAWFPAPRATATEVGRRRGFRQWRHPRASTSGSTT